MSQGDLERLSTAFDIQLSYKDLQENDIFAKRETLVAALVAMGAIESEVDIPDALARHEREAWHWHIEPVSIAWDRKRSSLRLRLPLSAATGNASLRIELEEGGVQERDIILDRARETARAAIDGEDHLELVVTLPEGLPYGYHRIELEAGGRRLESLLISAPRKAYAPSNGPAWGVFLPLYALHSQRSWGIGDYTDLERLTRWAGGRGASFVATLPLLPAFLDRPFAHSPYEPVSRLFWNEVYVDPEAPFPDGAAPSVDAALAAEARALLDAPAVDYAAVMRLKRSALEAQTAALTPGSPASEALDGYLTDRPDVRDYAAFRAAVEKLGPDWRRWPARARGGLLTSKDYDPGVARYYEYAQWRARTQIHAAADAAASQGMRFYLDLPVGVHPQGYDTWRYRDVFAQGMSVGAPPDLLSTNGQNWGFQPLVPRALRRSGYEYLVRYLRHHFASSKMLRIDHAIGLHRLYWIPAGASGRDGVFVRQPAEELYAILCLESMRYEAVVIAEDLGLVPPEVGRGLKAHAISGMYVQMFEMTGRSKQPLRTPKPDAVASFSTHDLPPFAAYWQDEDLKQREALALLTPERVAEEKAGRTRDRRALVAQLQQRGLVGDGDDVAQVFRGSTALLAETDATWVLLNLEDGWGETRSHNLPGTTNDLHPNWVSRAALGLDDFDAHEGLRKTIETVRLYRVDRSTKSAPRPAVPGAAPPKAGRSAGEATTTYKEGV